MKAITLWQPWASLIIDGRKPWETRPRPWKFIGEVAIHAGLHIDREACRRFGYDPDTIPHGAVLGQAYKSNCVRFPSLLCKPDEYGDYSEGRYGYRFQGVIKYGAPIPAKGKQGFWEWNPMGIINPVTAQTMFEIVKRALRAENI